MPNHALRNAIEDYLSELEEKNRKPLLSKPPVECDRHHATPSGILARTDDAVQKMLSKQACISRQLVDARSKLADARSKRRDLADSIYQLEHPGAQSRAEKRAKDKVLSQRYRDRRRRAKEVSTLSKLEAQVWLRKDKKFWASHTLYNVDDDCPKRMLVLEGPSVKFSKTWEGNDVEHGTAICKKAGKTISLHEMTMKVKAQGLFPPKWKSGAKRVFHMTFHSNPGAVAKYIREVRKLMGGNNGLRIVEPSMGQLRISREDVERCIQNMEGIAVDQIPARQWTPRVPYIRYHSFCMQDAETKQLAGHKRPLFQAFGEELERQGSSVGVLGHARLEKMFKQMGALSRVTENLREREHSSFWARV